MVLQKMRVSQNLSQIPGVSTTRIFMEGLSRSLNFFFNAKEVSGSQKRQKMYQSRRLAKSRVYHSTPLIVASCDGYCFKDINAVLSPQG